MHSRPFGQILRLVYVACAATVLVLGPIGCDNAGSNTETQAKGELPPSIEEANKNMQNEMMKNQAAKKK